MMKMRSRAPMFAAKAGYVAMSCAMIALGVLFIVSRGDAAYALVRALGATTLLFGIVKLTGYLSKDLYRLAFQFDFEFGILLVIVGAVLMIHPTLTLDVLAFALGAMTLADGLFKSRIALEAKRFGISSWWLIMILGIAADAAGAALIIRPAGALSVLIGASLIADGFLNGVIAIGTVRIIKLQYPDVIDPEYTEKEDDIR